MKTMSVAEMQSVHAGYTVYCPVCGYKSKTNWLRDIIWGKKKSIAYDQMWLQARHSRGGRWISGTKAHR